MSFIILLNSYRQPNMIMVNRAMKVHTFTNNPANISNTKISAVNALVFNVCLLIANLIVY